MKYARCRPSSAELGENMTERVARMFLLIKVGKKVSSYILTPLTPDPRVRVKAWRVTRWSDKKHYDVSLCPKGHCYCECLDFLKRHHECKHISVLKAYGLL